MVHWGVDTSAGSTVAGWMPDGQQPEKLTVSYTGCGNFSLRHHSSRHILGVIWGGYALLGKGGETVKARSPLLLYPLARATNQPLIGATGTGETELLGCCPEAFVPTPFLLYQQLQPRFLSKGKMGFCMLRIMSAHMRTPSFSELQLGKQPSVARRFTLLFKDGGGYTGG